MRPLKKSKSGSHLIAKIGSNKIRGNAFLKNHEKSKRFCMGLWITRTVHRKVIEIAFFFRGYVFSQNFDKNLSMLFAMKLRRVCSLFKKIRDSFLEHIGAQHELGLQIFVGH